LLPQNNEIGLPSRFNCQLFSEQYEVLTEGVRQQIQDYQRAEELVDEPDDPLRIIYEEECSSDRSETRVRIRPDLFAEMRNELTPLAP